MIGHEPKLTAAMVAASRNLESNLRALSQRQPPLSTELSNLSIDLEWVFGRDGSLTARVDGQWWSGCSLPRRTAQTLLQKMELKGTVICFLSPSDAAQLRVTLDRMASNQALLAVVPDLRDLRVMLACENFRTEIESGRLWFASGECWPEELEQLLITNDGLPTPGQFVRTMLVEKEEMDEMIRQAQEVFSRETARRTGVVRSLFEKSAPAASNEICVIAPGNFRLWEDIGPALSDIARACGAKIIDPDQPTQASPIAFARAAANCSTVLLANASRADLPADLPVRTRVITWMTGPRILHHEPRGEFDLLLVADERWQQMAIAANWPASNILLASWPSQPREGSGTGLGIIADTREIRLPEFTLTSQKILWESIARELSDDPFAAGDAGAYLSRWLRHASIAEETIDRALFVDRLIVPAYQQGLARWLTSAGVEVRLFGRGWGDVEEFSPRHAGEIREREELAIAIDACAALVHAWPAAWAHPIEATGRPVLKRGSKSKQSWLAEAKRLARGEGRASGQNETILSFETVRKAIRQTQPA